MSEAMLSPALGIVSTLLLTLVVFTVMWLIHVARRDAGVVDLWWGGGFFAMAAFASLFAPPLGSVQRLLLALVGLWAARLTGHILVRHLRAGGREDPRYATMRAGGGPTWPRRNLLTVFWVQAAVQWLLALPVLVAILRPAGDGAIGPLAIAGIGLYAIGFVVEALADHALMRFRSDPANRGRLLTTGLFAWSRHPNYFGEAVLWWGLGLVAVSATGTALVLLGPAALTLLLLKVSGIPPLEAELAKRPGWAAYAARTSAFVPWPPRGDRTAAGTHRPAA
jgi:steroid 5-alpha reductase family enzyme